ETHNPELTVLNSFFSPGIEKKSACTGLGLFYAFLSTIFFSVIALLVKKIENLHALEISAFRCFFQIIFLLPALIYNETGFLGPKGQRVFLFLRGLLGATGMILFFYAIQQMPLADATVIVFSNPVFTAIFARIFLKEKCTLWDLFFTVFTLTGVIIIARPPFLFGTHVSGIEHDYSSHIRGTVAAFASAITSASTFIVLRRMGKAVSYYLSAWYYAVIGLIVSVTVVCVMQEWRLPYCGLDRWLIILIGLLGIGGQTFLTKALQIEKAGPVAIIRTMDVVCAFIFQFVFLHHSPSWWSVGGAICVTLSTTGVGIQNAFVSILLTETSGANNGSPCYD
uniref:Solute carrier family 35 member G1 n=1 Tax=Latimeria chalumnae TaxID=7897 RepID=H3BCF8_LATCH